MASDESIPKSPYGADENFGIPHQRTRCRVLVHSHIVNNDLKGTIDASEDTIACQCNKTLKGGGGASVTLVPRRNYINYIFPNDWINIWFDPGDGRGFIRTFFGFVDRVSRNIITDATTGATTTRYMLSCSDFTKAFDKTNIYFNPHVADREDFVGLFAGTKNLAGSALRTKGVSVYGSPADIVLNLTHLMLGFNAQFTVPSTYPVDNAVIASSMKFRRNWMRQRLPSEVQTAIGAQTLTEWMESKREEAYPIASGLLENDVLAWESVVKTDFVGPVDPNNPAHASDTQIANRIKQFRIWQATDPENARQFATSLAMRVLLLKAKVDPNVQNSEEFKTALKMEESLRSNFSLLDLMDLSFVEYGAIDGSIVATSIWTQQGTLWSIINSYSNNIVNELFCDLRPLGADFKEYALQAGGYSRVPDEHGVNANTGQEQGDFAVSSNAVRFVPAMVMREYPFSTIDDIDAFKISVLRKTVGRVRFGSIFAQGVNVPGRQILSIEPLNESLKELYKDPRNKNEAIKHLDVAVISVQDIIAEDIGRSDGDVVNLIELYSDGFFGKHMKFLTQDAQPIANPISIVRHGLRVSTYNTRFARFSKKHKNFNGVDNFGTRRKLIRWALMLDHWYQHNIEYLNGNITCRAFPEIRVGYRLDIAERRESYYVEGVTHSWQYPEPMTTSLTLSRGQRNDPFPVYEKPALVAFGNEYGKGRRENSRLAHFFEQADPAAVLRSVTGLGASQYVSEVDMSKDSNKADQPELHRKEAKDWGSRRKTYVVAQGTEFKAALEDRASRREEINQLAARIVFEKFQAGGEIDAKVQSEARALATAILKEQPSTTGALDDVLAEFNVKGSSGTGVGQ